MRLNRLILILAAATLACRASGRLTPTSPPSAPPTSVPATPALAATPTGPPSTPSQPSPTPTTVDTPTSAPVVPPTEAASPTPEAIAVTPGTFDVTYQSNGLDLPATLCVPDLPGPLPAVVYNHG
ncbi:MAG: hypothetical protein ACE5FI_12860, partial [Anaerolineales bacterium]